VASLRKTVSATEQRNPRTRGIDLLSTRDILTRLNREDSTVAGAVAGQIPAIARAVDAMLHALRAGGRIIYVGAGTSGRLAALDAAEAPPTFGVSRRAFQAVLAGGRRALTNAVEGAEDSTVNGARDILAIRVTKRDVVIGLTASGSTPYVLAALKNARKAGAAAIGITSNDRSAIARVARILIAPKTGPEAIAGSTRLKAGTAQKMVLNMLSTATMVRLGRVYDNWMIGVALTNKKLQRRGVRILEQASGANVSDAERALRQSGHDLCVALIMLKRKIGAPEARLRLRNTRGDLRAALGERKRTGGRYL
jgi:N-acetylmuramic acid 6-phosphate etherase